MDIKKREAIADALQGIVDKAKHGGAVVRVGLMASGSELGSKEILAGAVLAEQEHPNLKVVAIGPRLEGFEELEWIESPDCDADISLAVHKALSEGKVAGVVAMHFSFPIGVATVGRIVTPSRGEPMFIASCTGTTASSRGEALLRNAIYGVATAKACGILKPTVAFLNLEGASSALRSLVKLREKGYAIDLGASQRGDGGSLLRGNDLVAGAVDVLVCDTLTGNALVKIFSTFTSGGQYESLGFGYGPSVGEGWDKVVSIVSRASGAPVIAAALAMTAKAASNKLPALVASELKAARAAGLDVELEGLKPKASSAKPLQKPAVVPVDAEISGVDVLDMEAAMHGLWEEGLYAETAMGCTGPVVRVQSLVKAKAEEILHELGYI